MEEENEFSHLKENYYETRGVGTGARSSKNCVMCGGTIERGTPHDMHYFYPRFNAYATHKECSEAFLKLVGE